MIPKKLIINGETYIATTEEYQETEFLVQQYESEGFEVKIYFDVKNVIFIVRVTRDGITERNCFENRRDCGIWAAGLITGLTVEFGKGCEVTE